MSKRSKPTYIALTTHNYQMHGYHIVLAAGHNKNAVKEAAEKMLDAPVNDIYANTEQKNLVVVSKTKAKRLGFNFDEWHPSENDRYQWIG